MMVNLWFLVIVSAALGGIIVFPIAYAMGGEFVHRENSSFYRARREAKQERRQA